MNPYGLRFLCVREMALATMKVEVEVKVEVKT